MSTHLMTVCIFCLLCATNTPCSAHTALNDRTQFADNVLPDRGPFVAPAKIVDKINDDFDGKISPKVKHKQSEASTAVQFEFEPTTNTPSNVEVNMRKRRHDDVRSSTALAKHYLEKLFSKLSSNKETMTFGDFQRLIARLGMNDSFWKNATDDKKCVNGETLLSPIFHGIDDRINSSQTISIRDFEQICPLLVYQLGANTSWERAGCIVGNDLGLDDEGLTQRRVAEQDKNLKVWIYSIISISIISACGLLGVLVIPFMQQHIYQQLLQFLVALAVGTLCGDALLHLLPHAMLPEHLHHHHNGKNSHEDIDFETIHNAAMWKGFAAVIAVVAFYLTEKFMTLGAEWRKRTQKKHKLPSRVRVMRDNEAAPGGDANKVSDKLCKHKYSSYPYCYDEIATDTKDDHHNRNANTDSAQTSLATPNTSLLNNTIESDIALMKNSTSQCTTLMDLSSRALEPDQSYDNLQQRALVANNLVNDPELRKGDVKDEESYTVILREHESRHHGHSHAHGHVHSAPNSFSSVAWMVIMGDGLHNFTDGMAIGAAFAADIPGGFSTSVAIFCHELPHEIGDFAVLLKAGMSAKQAIFYNLLSSILCVFGCILGIALGTSEEASGWIFAVAAGLFIYIALVDMMPELTSSHSNEGGSSMQIFWQFCGLMTGLGIMATIAFYEEDMKKLFCD